MICTHRHQPSLATLPGVYTIASWQISVYSCHPVDKQSFPLCALTQKAFGLLT